MLRDLLVLESVRQEIIESGGLEAIYAILRSTDIPVLRAATKCVAMYALIHENVRLQMAKIDVFERCVRNLLHSDHEVQSAAADAIRGFCLSENLLEKLIVDFDGVANIVQLLNETSSDSVRRSVARTLSMMSACGRLFHSRLSKKDVMDVLVSGLEFTDDDALQSIVRCIAELTASTSLVPFRCVPSCLNRLMESNDGVDLIDSLRSHPTPIS